MMMAREPGIFSQTKNVGETNENQIKISNEEYKSIVNMLVFHLRHVEEHMSALEGIKKRKK